MSWDVIAEIKLKCPCGEGEYVMKTEMDDRNRISNSYEMLCPECKEKYYYDYSLYGNQPKSKGIERGWTLKKKAVSFTCMSCNATIFNGKICYREKIDLPTSYCPNCGKKVEHRNLENG